MPREARPFSLGLRLALVLPSLALLALFLASRLSQAEPLRLVWGTSYVLSLALLTRRLTRGALLDPLVCLAGSYLVLLALGSFLFEAIRERALTPWAFNAIGAGHAALFLGAALVPRAPPATAGAWSSIPSRPAAELLLLVLAAALAGCVALFASFGGVPLLADDPDEARLAILSGHGALALSLVGLGLLAFAFLHDARVRGGTAWRAHALGALTFLVYLGLGGRARALLFVLGYVGLELWLRPRRLRLGWLALAGAAGLALLAAVGAWRRGGTVGAEEALAELGIGALALPAMVARLEQRLEPGTLGAGPWSDLLTLLPGEDRGANVALKYVVFENWRELPDSAGVNPSLIGEGYVHFGALGVVLAPFLLALVSALFHRRAARARGFLGQALYVCWITGMMAAVSAGVGIRLTHFVQQLAWLLVLTPFFLVRSAGSKAGSKAQSKAPSPVARVARPA